MHAVIHCSPNIPWQPKRAKFFVEGFRKIGVEITTDAAKKYRVQARPGYRPRGGF